MDLRSALESAFSEDEKPADDAIVDNTQAEVTPDKPVEARARDERAMLGSTDVADVTTGRAAWWNADNAGGTVLPDAVNAANNGTIVAGNVLTL